MTEEGIKCCLLRILKDRNPWCMILGMSAVYKEIRHFLPWVDPVILSYQFQLTKEDTVSWMSRIVLVVKNPPANAGDVKDVGSISGLGRSPGGGSGNPLQYSCLENPMARGAWWATVHMVEKNQTKLKQLSTQIYKASSHLRRTSVVLSEECVPLARKHNSGEYTIKKPHGICRGRRERVWYLSAKNSSILWWTFL